MGRDTGDAPVCYWPIFPLSPVTVPEVFAKVNLAQFPSSFQSGKFNSITKCLSFVCQQHPKITQWSTFFPGNENTPDHYSQIIFTFETSVISSNSVTLKKKKQLRHALSRLTHVRNIFLYIVLFKFSDEIRRMADQERVCFQTWFLLSLGPIYFWPPICLSSNKYDPRIYFLRLMTWYLLEQSAHCPLPFLFVSRPFHYFALAAK